jgi:O-Antigen ligase
MRPTLDWNVPEARLPLLAVALPATAIRRAAEVATLLIVVLALVLPDVLANAGLTQAWMAAMAAGALLLIAASPRIGIRPGDVGLALICGATIWPRLVSGSATPPGALAFIVVMYATGRMAGLRPDALTVSMLAAGAFMGCVAIVQSIHPLAPLVPFVALRDGAPLNSSRATGLFDNPNTLGALEAVVLLLAARAGSWRGSRIPLVAACVAGLILSSSREAVLGLLVGLGAIWIGATGPRLVTPEGRRRAVSKIAARPLLVAALTLLAVLAVLAIPWPGTLQRLNPASFATDHNILDRVASWQAALAFVPAEPPLGYGAKLPVDVIDNAYLGWLLAGGAIGVALWLLGLAVLTPRRLWPILAGLLVIGVFSNPFAVGPAFAAFLIACGATDRVPQAASSS